MHEFIFDSPLDKIKLKATENAIVQLIYVGNDAGANISRNHPKVIRNAVRQLNEYFEGERKNFDLPLAPDGTEFQLKVWDLLKEIPYGTTTTYSKLSEKLGKPKAIRALGRANGQNPIPIIIPCHRVIGANDDLIGYSGGIDRKRRLLQHEGTLLL